MVCFYSIKLHFTHICIKLYVWEYITLNVIKIWIHEMCGFGMRKHWRFFSSYFGQCAWADHAIFFLASMKWRFKRIPVPENNIEWKQGKRCSTEYDRTITRERGMYCMRFFSIRVFCVCKSSVLSFSFPTSMWNCSHILPFISFVFFVIICVFSFFLFCCCCCSYCSFRSLFFFACMADICLSILWIVCDSDLWFDAHKHTVRLVPME